MPGKLKGLAFVGYKKTGKTTLITNLATLLKKQGKKVAIAKYTHHDFFLNNNTDTEKFRALGIPTIGLSEKETFISWPQKRYLPDLLPLLEADFLLVEGGKNLTWLPRILLIQEEKDLETLNNGLALGYFSEQKLNSSLPHFKNPQELALLIEKKGFVLPGLDCQSCGLTNCLEAGKLIVQEKASLQLCQALNQSSLKIKVNGYPLSTNPFVCKLIEKTLIAMLSELKGFAPGKITLELHT